MNRKELRHDRHTVSLLTDHLVFSPKYRGKMLVSEAAMICEVIPLQSTRAQADMARQQLQVLKTIAKALG